MYLTGNPAITRTGSNFELNVGSNIKLSIYIDGVITFTNNFAINNNSQIPANLYIYSTYTSAAGVNGVTLENGNTCFTALYAPRTGIRIGNTGEFFGSVVGGTITVETGNNRKVHFDQVLAKPGDLVKWSEL